MGITKLAGIAGQYNNEWTHDGNAAAISNEVRTGSPSASRRQAPLLYGPATYPFRDILIPVPQAAFNLKALY
jgi:hypothetical protein